MQINFDSMKPIYVQIAEAIEDDIVTGKLLEGEQVYSQLVLSRELNVNPATAAKGINLLVQKGILDKQRGLSMIVAADARSRLLFEKRENDFISLAKELIDEAKKIELSEEQVIDTIKELFTNSERGEENA